MVGVELQKLMGQKLALRTVWQRLDVNYLGKFHSLGVKAFLPDLWREGVSEGAKLSLCTMCKNSVLNSSLVVFHLLHGNVLEVTTDLEMTAISIFRAHYRQVHHPLTSLL